VKRLRHVSQDLGCEAELDGVLEIAEGESGADRQRTVFEKHGSLRAVVEHLVAETA
jgi:carboxylate-amine ligase